MIRCSFDHTSSTPLSLFVLSFVMDDSEYVEDSQLEREFRYLEEGTPPSQCSRPAPPSPDSTQEVPATEPQPSPARSVESTQEVPATEPQFTPSCGISPTDNYPAVVPDTAKDSELKDPNVSPSPQGRVVSIANVASTSKKLKLAMSSTQTSPIVAEAGSQTRRSAASAASWAADVETQLPSPTNHPKYYTRRTHATHDDGNWSVCATRDDSTVHPKYQSYVTLKPPTKSPREIGTIKWKDSLSDLSD